MHRRTCSLSSIQISQALFGSPHIARLHDFPGHLTELKNRTAGLLGDEKYLALRHTLLGYFLTFIPAARGADLLASVVRSSTPDIKMRLGIPASGVGGYHPLKCCQECVHSDIQKLGWPIWHLEHQLPSVLVCREHQRPLLLRWEPTTPVHRREWITPSVKTSAQLFEIPVASEQALAVLTRLANFSAEAASLSPGELQSEKLAQTYQHWAASNAGLSKGRCLRHSILARALNTPFNLIANTLSDMGPAACNLQLAPLIGSVARSTPKAAHPLKHLALISCMYENWEQFRSDYRSAIQRSTARLQEEISSPQCHERLSTTAQFIELVQESKLSIRRAAAAVGISTTTGICWAKINDLSYTSRAKKLTPKFLEHVRELLRLGKEKSEIISLTKISSVSLNRLLSSEPNLRAQWLSATFECHKKAKRLKFLTVLNAHPELPIWRLRKLPGSGWTWLYRHDKDWLDSASARFY